MNELPSPLEQISYLAKVLAGLLVVILLGLASLELAHLPGATGKRAAWVLAGVCALLAWLGYRRYRRLDELQRQMHGRACQWAVGLVLASLLVVSAMQALGLSPSVHPLAVAAGLIGAWGLGLCITHHRVH
jgi:4-amino-4-deoxy-L-arabinose transferase-like glycosyltransferase